MMIRDGLTDYKTIEIKIGARMTSKLHSQLIEQKKLKKA